MSNSRDHPEATTKELKDLEEHQLIKRTAYTGAPVLTEDTPDEYKEV